MGKTAAVVVSTSTLFLGLAILALHSWQMGSRVAELEDIVARQTHTASAAGSVGSGGREAVQVALQSWRASRAGEGDMDEEEAAALVEVALEEALERKTQEAEDAEIDRYLEMATESIEVEVEDLQDEFPLSDEQITRAINISVEGLHEGFELRQAIERRDISMRQAKAEGEALKQDYQDALLEVLGDAAFFALGEKFYPGRGWD